MVEIVVVSHWYDFRHALKLLGRFQPLSSRTNNSSLFPALLKGPNLASDGGWFVSRLILSDVF